MTAASLVHDLRHIAVIQTPAMPGTVMTVMKALLTLLADLKLEAARATADLSGKLTLPTDSVVGWAWKRTFAEQALPG
jgi:hypothetical protein